MSRVLGPMSCWGDQTICRELARLAEADIRCGQPLAPFTSLKVGGPAEYFARVRTVAELERCLDAAVRLGLPWLVLGGGSNVLVSERGVRGLVAVNQARGYRADESGDAVGLRCQSGTPLAGLARACARRGWRGLEFAGGIPGTMGGAIAGNAGAYSGCMADVVRSVEVWTPTGRQVWQAAELAFAYRCSRLKRRRDAVILAADLTLVAGDPGGALAAIAANEEHRRARQPSERSAGSVFKNPPGDYAGRLIEAAGLKGTRYADAEISRVHANFFVNLGSATAGDILALIRLAREGVFAAAGARLELEILPVGEWTAEEIESLAQ